MTSDETLELLEDRARRHQQKGLRFLDSDRERAAACFRTAASIHELLASESQGQSVRQTHFEQAAELESSADRLQGIEEPHSSRPEKPADESVGSDTDEESTSSLQNSTYFEAPPDLDLSDVGGMDELKTRLRRDVQKPLENPKYYEKQGVGIENGVLFYGPPGTGKSYLTKCFAGELGWNYAEIKSSDIVTKWVGEAAQHVSELFDEAREHEPAVVFIDELDALASDRSDGPKKTNSERQMVNELLQQLQNVQGSDILVVAATNKRADLDSAVTRSGRFNQEFYVGAPDAAARKSILEVQLDTDERAVDWESINWQKLIDWTTGFSAADLAAVVQKAVRQSSDESTDRDELVPVQYRHLLEAMKDIEPSLDETDPRG